MSLKLKITSLIFLICITVINVNAKTPLELKAEKDDIEVQLLEVLAEIGERAASSSGDSDALAEVIYSGLVLQNALKKVSLKYYPARLLTLRTYADYEEVLQELEEDRLLISGQSRKNAITEIQSELLSIRCVFFSEKRCFSQMSDEESLNEFLKRSTDIIIKNIQEVYGG